jgi:hypothetical protein
MLGEYGLFLPLCLIRVVCSWRTWRDVDACRVSDLGLLGGGEGVLGISSYWQRLEETF